MFQKSHEHVIFLGAILLLFRSFSNLQKIQFRIQNFGEKISYLEVEKGILNISYSFYTNINTNLIYQSISPMPHSLDPSGLILYLINK